MQQKCNHHKWATAQNFCDLFAHAVAMNCHTTFDLTLNNSQRTHTHTHQTDARRYARYAHEHTHTGDKNNWILVAHWKHDRMSASKKIAAMRKVRKNDFWFIVLAME